VRAQCAAYSFIMSNWSRWIHFHSVPGYTGASDRGITAKNIKNLSIPISTNIRLIKVLVWPVATYGCENWTLRKNEEIRLDAFEM